MSEANWDAAVDKMKREDVAFFRRIDPRFNQYTDEEISSLYGEYSAMMACASWLITTEKLARDFCRWAFTTPADLIRSR